MADVGTQEVLPAVGCTDPSGSDRAVRHVRNDGHPEAGRALLDPHAGSDDVEAVPAVVAREQASARGVIEAKPKKRGGTSPSARTLAECRKRGYIAQAVERFNSYTKKRIDLFGVIDIVAITPTGILGIQACAGGDHSTRRKKILAEPRIAAWLGAGARLEVWSWSKRGRVDERKLWQVRIDEIRADEFTSKAVSP